MMFSKKIPLSSTYKKKLFQFARSFDNVAWLDSQLNSLSNSQSEEVNTKEKHNTEDTLVALGKRSFLSCNAGTAFEQLNQYTSDNKWAFGFLSYDLKNEVENNLSSNNIDGLNFPDLYFFEPEVIVRIQNKEVEVLSHDNLLLNKLCDERSWVNVDAAVKTLGNDQTVDIKSRLSKSEYIDKVVSVKERIVRGDVYEMNFCHEFYVENTHLDPFNLNESLVDISPTPFSSFFRVEEHYVMCASPERFLKKTGSKVISQPIKGTIKRGKDLDEDEQMKVSLLNNPKERSENVMIVDLVRNDLSQIAMDGSVNVDELCSVYTFPQVHQMISTVSCDVEEGVNAAELISKCFPMGSMTGAPKIKAMEIIEELEETRRGLFSGSIGYITPKGDFDFNVLIRSLFYNADAKYLSFSVGGAITQGSDPELEYQESLLKAKAIFEVLS
jgi:para-aminobenzoate synthetase component 1